MEQVKRSSDLERGDKSQLTNVLRFLSVAGVIFSIILATTMFLINNQEQADHVLTFAIVSILVTLLSVANFIWAWTESKRLKASKDNFVNETDNQFTRFILSANIILFTVFAVYFIIYTFDHTTLWNLYESTHTDLEITNFKQFINGKDGWINFMGIVILVSLIYAAYTSFQLSSSGITWKLQIYVLGIVLLLVSYWQIDNLKELEAVFTGYIHNGHQLDQPAYTITYILSILAIVFLVVLYAINTRSISAAYMVLGMFFLLIAGIQVLATGRIFRNYHDVQASLLNTDNCAYQMQDLHHTVLEQNGCPHKYFYDDNIKCPSSNNPGDCFKNTQTTCSNVNDLNHSANNYESRVWEQDLVEEPQRYVVQACMDDNCCGIVSNLFTSQVLDVAGYSLATIIIAFAIGVFAFQSSSIEKSGPELQRLLQVVLLVAFFCILVGGTFLVLVRDYKPYNQQSLQIERLETEANGGQPYHAEGVHLAHLEGSNQGFQFSHPQPGQGMNTYAPAESCQFLRDYVKADEHHYFELKNKNVPATFPKSQNFDKILDDIQNNAATTEEIRNFIKDQGFGLSGLIVAIRIEADKAQTGQYFNYTDVSTRDDSVVILEQTSAAEVYRQLHGDAAHDKPADLFAEKREAKVQYFGLIGQTQVVQQIINNKLRWCPHKDTANTKQVQIVIQAVDLSKLQFYKENVQVELNGSDVNPTSNNNRRMLMRTHKSHNKHVQAPEHKNNEDPDVKATFAESIAALKTWEFRTYFIRVFETEHQVPIKGAKVTIYAVEKTWTTNTGNTNHFLHSNPDFGYCYEYPTYPEAAATATKPQFSIHGNAAGTLEWHKANIIPQKAIYRGVSNNNGDIEFGYIYNSQDEYDKNFIVYVEHEGFYKNCRQFELLRTDNAFTGNVNANVHGYFRTRPRLDVGLVRHLSKNQAAVTLEWEPYYKSTSAHPLAANAAGAAIVPSTTPSQLQDSDFDLHATFTTQILDQQETCSVGPLQQSCSSLHFHGQNTTTTTGNTTETIYWDVIGPFDYLVYIHREVNNTQFNNEEDLFQLQPVIKYWVPEYTEGPVYVSGLDQFTNVNAQKKVEFADTANELNANYLHQVSDMNDWKLNDNLSFLQFCVFGTTSSSETIGFSDKAFPIDLQDATKRKTQSVYNLWGSKTSIYTQNPQGNKAKNQLPDNIFNLKGQDETQICSFLRQKQKLIADVDAHGQPNPKFPVANPPHK